MANVQVTNSASASNPDYKVKVTLSGDEAIQHVNIDSFSAGDALNSTSTAQEASRIVKASAGKVYVVSGYNNSATDQFIQLFNSATLPANGVVPVLVIMAPANSTFGYSGGAKGRSFSTGIVICNSSTAVTKTIGSANCLFDVQYE